MENRPSSIKDLLEEAEEYGRTNLELLKLKTLDISSDFLSSCASQLIGVLILFLFLLMLSLGAAYLAGDLLGRLSYGFFIVSAFYAVVLLMLYLFLGKQIKRYISNLIIRQAMKRIYDQGKDKQRIERGDISAGRKTGFAGAASEKQDVVLQ